MDGSLRVTCSQGLPVMLGLYLPLVPLGWAHSPSVVRYSQQDEIILSYLQ